MRVGAMALSLLLAGAAPLFAADTPKYEIAGTYGFMHDTDRAENFPAGWALAATGNINSWAGVVAEVGGGYATCKNCQRGPFASQLFRGRDLHIRVLTYMGGPRVSSHAWSAFTPFAQVLFGGSHMSGGTEFDGALNTGFTYQPGAGIDVRVGPRVGIRLEGDYRVIRTTGHNNNQSRFLAGAVYTFGTQ
jgi:outer membrane protein with beta-barrel domain